MQPFICVVYSIVCDYVYSCALEHSMKCNDLNCKILHTHIAHSISASEKKSTKWIILIFSIKCIKNWPQDHGNICCKQHAARAHNRQWFFNTAILVVSYSLSTRMHAK